MKIRDSVMRFAEAMEAELKENDHKGGWKECNIHYLIGRLRNECVELEDVLWGRREMSGNKGIRNEAVDIANFAMMIFDNHQKPAEQPEEKE